MEADAVILATDPDREGEAISWHVLEALKARRVLKGKPVQRVDLQRDHQGCGHARDGPPARDRSGPGRCVSRAPRARLSGRLPRCRPSLWRKLPGAALGRARAVRRAAARSASARARSSASSRREYWTLDRAGLRPRRATEFEARLVDARRQEARRSLDIGRAKSAARASRRALEAARRCTSPPSKRSRPRRHPAPPFTTSTLQQEAARKLGFAASAHDADRPDAL